MLVLLGCLLRRWSSPGSQPPLAFPTRRTALVSLTVGLCFWAAGSAIVLTSGDRLRRPDSRRPANRSSSRRISAWRLSSSSTCAAGRRTPGRSGSRPRSSAAALRPWRVCCSCRWPWPTAPRGSALLLALLYPVIDLLLATLVVGQAVLRLRDGPAPRCSSGVGFVALAVADSSLALNLQQRPRTSPTWSSTCLYGVAFALVVSAACARRPDLGVPQERRQRAGMLMGAAAIALAAWPSDRAGSPTGTSPCRPWSPSSLRAGGSSSRCATPRVRPTRCACRAPMS